MSLDGEVGVYAAVGDVQGFPHAGGLHVVHERIIQPHASCLQRKSNNGHVHAAVGDIQGSPHAGGLYY
eukprot:scaffold4194_cov22-Tisochrysis_lutea.AAC.1